MNQVWFVSEGSYSDYGVLRVFASRELADAYAAGAEGRFVEGPHDVVDALAEPVSVLHLGMRFQAAAEVGEQLTPWGREHVDLLFVGLDPDPPGRCQHRVSVLAAKTAYPPYVDAVWLTVEGTDHERVRKVYSEQRAQILARFDLMVMEGAS